MVSRMLARCRLEEILWKAIVYDDGFSPAPRNRFRPFPEGLLSGFCLRVPIFRVGRRHLGRDGLPPAGQPVAEARGVGRTVAGEVLLLADIRGEVEELGPTLFVPLDQLEVSLTDGPAGLAALVAVMRIMPEQGVATERPGPPQEWKQALAVDDLAGAWWDSGDLPDGGIEILSADRHVTDGSRRGHPGPGDDERHPDAP